MLIKFNCLILPSKFCFLYLGNSIRRCMSNVSTTMKPYDFKYSYKIVSLLRVTLASCVCVFRNLVVRPACTSDFEGVKRLVKELDLHRNLLVDLTQFNKARRDDHGTEIQAYVADCNKQVVGIAIVRREEVCHNSQTTSRY